MVGTSATPTRRTVLRILFTRSDYNVNSANCRYVAYMPNVSYPQRVQRRRPHPRITRRTSSGGGLYARSTYIRSLDLQVGGRYLPQHGSVGSAIAVGATPVLQPHHRWRLRRVTHSLEQSISAGNMALLVAVLLSVPFLNLLTRPGAPLARFSYRPVALILPPSTQSTTLANFTTLQARSVEPSAALQLSASSFQSLGVSDYRLRAGDTLSGLAQRFGLAMGTIASFNSISDVRRMRAGATYRIPDRDGLLYTVARGDSLSAIAERHDVSPDFILDANDLASVDLTPGIVLFIPGAHMSDFNLKLVLGELLIYPLRGKLTSGFGYRNDPFTGLRAFHYGIDIAARSGSTVRAAMPGVVSYIDQHAGNYGHLAIIRHANGFRTLYAHLSTSVVSPGTYVAQGQKIGAVGNTGRSTGPHLHFFGITQRGLC